MPDLESLGKRLRALRESRGITQDQVVERSGVYSESSSLRKIERGEQRPKRAAIIALSAIGLEERDPNVIDELLASADYEALSDPEVARLGLTRPPPTPQDRSATDETVRAVRAPISEHQLHIWDMVIGVCATMSIWLAALQDWFVFVTCILYAGLFVVSVLLETAYESRGSETVRAAMTAGAMTLAGSLGGLWMDSRLVLAGRPEGLWLVLLLFVVSAAMQWALARPGLPAHATVRARFQPHTAQAAHLKNSLYFLFMVVAFWIPPRHCVEASHHGGSAVMMFCPRPVWLWGAFVLVVAASIPMGSRLLENLEPSPRQNLYVTLFYVRALLYGLLSVICLAWYSTEISLFVR
jgi:transcriptional regulator with XRE-family HTH domain